MVRFWPIRSTNDVYDREGKLVVDTRYYPGETREEAVALLLQGGYKLAEPTPPNAGKPDHDTITGEPMSEWERRENSLSGSD